MDPKLYKDRISRLQEQLYQAGLGVAVLSRPQHIFYFTGVMPGPSPALLVFTVDHVLGIAPIRLGECETLTYVDYDIRNGWNHVESVRQLLQKCLPQTLSESQRAGLELDHFPAAWKMALLTKNGEPVDLKDLLWRMRRRKDEEELRQIERNIAGNDRVFQEVRTMLRPGVSELDIWGVIQNRMNENAGEPVILEADLGVGVRGSNPDAKPGHQPVERGETLFIDIYSATHHYYADTTRVFSLGSPDDHQKQVHSILMAALAAGEQRLVAGTPANQVDKAVRGVIEQAGYGASFPHHSGHAYGLFQQEKPYFIPADPTPLEAGMIVTLEPGIYLPGWGGMRLEGNYLITNAGPRRLDHFPSELIVCG